VIVLHFIETYIGEIQKHCLHVVDFQSSIYFHFITSVVLLPLFFVLLFFCALRIFNYSDFLAFLFIYNNYHFKILNSLINHLERQIVYYKFCSIKCAAYDNTNK